MNCIGEEFVGELVAKCNRVRFWRSSRWGLLWVDVGDMGTLGSGV